MRYLIALLALAGMVVSTLALRVHYSTDTAPCSIYEKWDCGIVNHSQFAEVAHVPVAAIGIAGYLLLAGLALAKWRFPLFLASVAGFCFALRLTLVEQLALGVWCKYCVVSQCIIVVTMLVSLGWFWAEYRALKRASRRA
jgi:uncharacterized membrane protein